MFPPEQQTVADEVLGGRKFAPGYERTYWDGCAHGFAVRGDLVRCVSYSVTVSFPKSGLHVEQPEGKGRQRR